MPHYKVKIRLHKDGKKITQSLHRDSPFEASQSVMRLFPNIPEREIVSCEEVGKVENRGGDQITRRRYGHQLYGKKRNPKEKESWNGTM